MLEADMKDLAEINARQEVAYDLGGQLGIETKRREQVEGQRHGRKQIAVEAALVDEGAELAIDHLASNDIGDGGRQEVASCVGRRGRDQGTDAAATGMLVGWFE